MICAGLRNTSSSFGGQTAIETAIETAMEGAIDNDSDILYEVVKYDRMELSGIQFSLIVSMQVRDEMNFKRVGERK